MEQARLDALVDLVMGNAHVETVVDLLVPVATGAHAPASAAAPAARQSPRRHRPRRQRRDARAAAEAAFGQGAAAVAQSVTAARRVTRSWSTSCSVPGHPRDPRCGSVWNATPASTLGEWLQVAANPFLSTTPLARPPRPDTPTGVTQAPAPSRCPPRRRTRTTAGQGVVHRRVRRSRGRLGAGPRAGRRPAQPTPTPAIRITTGQPGTADGDTQRRRTYRPGKALAERVRARDRHCRFPGCSVPASRCHLDHVVPVPAGAHRRGQPAAPCAPPTTGSSTTPAGPSP